MSNEVVVHKGRTNVIVIKLGYNISADTWTSEIRTQPVQESVLIATWDVEFVTDGSDGDLRLTLNEAITSQIKLNTGYMDLKRVTGGEPVPVFDRPLEVIFRGTVTE
jgi:hypothetical protein